MIYYYDRFDGIHLAYFLYILQAFQATGPISYNIIDLPVHVSIPFKLHIDWFHSKIKTFIPESNRIFTCHLVANQNYFILQMEVGVRLYAYNIRCKEERERAIELNAVIMTSFLVVLVRVTLQT